MIASPVELIEHLAQAIRRSPGSEAAGFTAALGPLRIRLTLHGADAAARFFEVLPSAEGDTSSRDASPGTQGIDFAIEIIDAAGCGMERPRLTWTAEDFSVKRGVPGWSGNDWTTYFLRGEQGLAVADWRSGQAYVWVPSVSALPMYERAAPFRWLIDGLAQRHGLTAMHAAAIGENGAGLLIVGEGGRGKSTLATAAIGAGMSYLADDYCLVDSTAPCQAYRLFNTAKLRTDSKLRPHWLASIASETEPGPGGKHIFNLASHAPAALVDRLALRALLLPEFTDDAQPSLERVSPREAFRRAAPSTVAQSEGSEEQVVGDIGRLVRALPSYRIRMPGEPGRSIELLRDLLRNLQSSSASAPQ